MAVTVLHYVMTISCSQFLAKPAYMRSILLSAALASIALIVFGIFQFRVSLPPATIGASSSSPAQMGAAKKLVQDLVAQHPVMVFSKSYCPYCMKAKQALASVGLKADQVFALELEDRSDCSDIQDALGELTGARSVPRVFIAGTFIGGGDDTARKAANGELKALLAEKKIL